MRKLIYAINITLDGCVDHTKGMADEEIHEYFANMLGEVDTLVYGRKTYELMVPFWPDMAKTHSGSTEALNKFAHAFDSVEHIVVFSRTPGNMDDNKTRVVSTGLKEEILRLKQEEGKDMLLGGVDVPTQLMELDLIDEYRFVVQPLLVGAGRRLFDAVSMAEKLKLSLVASKVFKSGAVALHYVK